MVASKSMIRVVIADDSLVAREMLSQILGSDPGIEVVGQASNGAEAVEMVHRLGPDLVTMDIHMPRMNGLEATERIMAFHPTPILVVSSSVHGEETGQAFKALSLGALEVMKKPEPRDWADLERIGREIIRTAKILANVHVITHIRGRRASQDALTGQRTSALQTYDIVAIGSSTGGPSAVLSVLESLPKEFPASILIAQHIAEGFVPGLVGWLNAGTAVEVTTAEPGIAPSPGTAYVAPTGRNLVLEHHAIALRKPTGDQLYVPSADTLFESVARARGRHAIGVILTGMGADGAVGLKRMRERGAVTIAQNEETCTVFGMPRAAIEAGAADRVLPVSEIGEAIVELVGAGTAVEEAAG